MQHIDWIHLMSDEEVAGLNNLEDHALDNGENSASGDEDDGKYYFCGICGKVPISVFPNCH